MCSQLGAKILKWVAMSSCRESSWLRDRTHVSCVSWVGRWILYHWVIWEAPPKLMKQCNIYLFTLWLLSLKLFYIRYDMNCLAIKKGNLDIILYYLSIKYGRWDLLCSVQFSSIAQLCPTLCNSMVCSMPGFPVHHQLPELTQTHVRWVGDTIQPSLPLSSPSPPAFNLSQHQSLFQWVSSLHQVAKVLEFQLQHQSFQWIFRTEFL